MVLSVDESRLKACLGNPLFYHGSLARLFLGYGDCRAPRSGQHKIGMTGQGMVGDLLGASGSVKEFALVGFQLLQLSCIAGGMVFKIGRQFERVADERRRHFRRAPLRRRMTPTRISRRGPGSFGTGGPWRGSAP